MMNASEQIIHSHLSAINEFGFSLTVAPQTEVKPFIMAYTSGLSKGGFPEVAVTLPIKLPVISDCIGRLVALWKLRGLRDGRLAEVIHELDVLIAPLDNDRVGRMTEWFKNSRIIADHLGYTDKLYPPLKRPTCP